VSIAVRKLKSGQTVYDVIVYRNERDWRGRRKKIQQTFRTALEACKAETRMKAKAEQEQLAMERRWQREARREVRRETACVYALRAGDHVKIGTTAGPIAARMNDLATGCPYPIICVGWQVGGPSLENALHRYFADHREHGEWFSYWPIADNLTRLLPRRLGPFGDML
jgi:hypothetical protein